MRKLMVLVVVAAGWFWGHGALAQGQERRLIPHAQDRPPNDPYSAEEAAKRMTVPPGFSVEVVASEPMVVNPVAMTIDERGRFWITESLEYPRRSPGKGRDRLKVLEDTDGDGKADKATIFAEGLNIPSGVAVGGGGVWVANAPDLLFLQDTDGDGKADKTEVVLTGFGRDDTHELPNSLTWGPDGWLYGLNGVFNRSVVTYRGRTYDFTCTLFRIHPKTRDFELFAEGTSNPWGVAFNTEGEAFLSACVIDHLWHITQSGYYHRQGGPYPPNTWKIESIVDYKHQKAAYCGITFFDSDAYPKEFREKLYMGNIHGGCINVDALKRNGSTYQGVKEPDFLTANDSWFMPVVQKTGPDGSLYILDWYDRYHCYQDANRDPEGIDRLKGRLYRVRYKDTPRTPAFNLADESDDQLIKRLGSPNIYYREHAQRLLGERARPETAAELEGIVLEPEAPRKQRMHALWARVSMGAPGPEFLSALLEDKDATIRAWGVRTIGEGKNLPSALQDRFLALINDPAPEVKLQVAIAIAKLPTLEPWEVYPKLLANAGKDLLIHKIVWRNMQPSLAQEPRKWMLALESRSLEPAVEAPLKALVPRIIELWTASDESRTVGLSARLLDRLAMAETKTSREVLASFELIARKLGSGEISGKNLDLIRGHLSGTVEQLLATEGAGQEMLAVARLGSHWSDATSLELMRKRARNQDLKEEDRLDAAALLVERGDTELLDVLLAAIKDTKRGSVDYRRRLYDVTSRVGSEKVADTYLDILMKENPALRNRVIDALMQRPEWGKKLVAAIKAKKLEATLINLNQVRRLLASKDEQLLADIKAVWGTIREGRNPQRELVIDSMRRTLSQSEGDPFAGRAVFNKLCAQCHKIYGEGQEVGPDITLNGRSSYEQLLSNVFDPSLVIGEAYQSTLVATQDGRILTGLVVENTPQRLVLKIQGGKTEIIARSAIDEIKQGKTSLMPEDLEKQLSLKEIADLFSFLVLDKPPGDASAKLLPGTPTGLVK